MKKVKILLFVLFLMLSMEVGATSLSIGLSCPESTKAGSTINCTITGNISGGTLTGLAAKYTIAGGLTYNSFSINSNWNQFAASANGFSIGNTAGKTGSTTFGVAKFNVPETAVAGTSFTVTLRDIDCSDIDGNAFYASNISKTIKILNTNNNLTSLTVNGTQVSNFSSSTLTYTLSNTDASSIVIAATKEDNKATISGIGTKNLNYGLNTFTIAVKAENGSIKNYVIKVTRNDYRSKDNTLKALSVNVGTIAFNKNTTSYTIIADHTVNSVTIKATANDSKATVSGTGTKTLKDYANKFSIVVKAENGSTKTYSIVINRRDKDNLLGALSNDNYLKSLSIKNSEINFDKNTLVYNLEIGTDVTSLNIDAISSNSNATISIMGNENFKLGLNKVEIAVKAENGEIRTYTINVMQAKITLKMTMIEFKALKEITSDISVSLTDDYALTKQALDLIKNSKKIVYFNKYNNDDLLYTITLNGEKILDTKDTSVEVAFGNKGIAKLLNYPDSLYFNIKDELPEGTTLKVFTNKEDEKLKLYRYDKKVNLINKEIVNNNGYAEFDILSDGNYIITLSHLEKEFNSLLIVIIIETVLLICLIIKMIIGKKSKKK